MRPHATVTEAACRCSYALRSVMRLRATITEAACSYCYCQVSVMQQELQDLQPELIKTSANTEQLMVKIEQDTVEVEAKREVRTVSLCC